MENEQDVSTVIQMLKTLIPKSKQSETVNVTSFLSQIFPFNYKTILSNTAKDRNVDEQIIADEWKQTQQIGKQLGIEYKKWIQTQNDVVEVEQMLTYKLKVFGKCDALVFKKVNGQLYATIIEIKTTSDTFDFLKYGFDRCYVQLLSYKTMLTWMLKELCIENVIVELEIVLLNRKDPLWIETMLTITNRTEFLGTNLFLSRYAKCIIHIDKLFAW